MKNTKMTWLITGCSSGLGKAFAEEVLQNGYQVVITARDTSSLQEFIERYPDQALVLALDITDQDNIRNVISRSKERFGKIDVLINNAGYGYRAAVEEGNDPDVRNLFETMFFGTLNMIKAVLPDMRARRSGTIINLSSIAGRFSQPGSGYYSAAKFALEGMSDALRKEVKPLGIRVMVVEPGAFRTDFAGRSLKGTTHIIAEYEATVGPRRKENDHSGGTQPGDPKKAAQALLMTVETNEIPFRLLLGSDAIKKVRHELDEQYKELAVWQHISLSTDLE